MCDRSHQPIALLLPPQEEVKKACSEIASFPPLVFAGECRTLQARLAKCTTGEAFILQVTHGQAVPPTDWAGVDQGCCMLLPWLLLLHGLGGAALFACSVQRDRAAAGGAHTWQPSTRPALSLLLPCAPVR